MGFLLLVLGDILSWTQLSGYSWVWFSKPLYNCAKVLRVSMDNGALSNVWSVMVLEILTWSWTQLMLSFFIAVLFKIISNGSFILYFVWFCLRVEGPWNVFGSRNSWVCDLSINSLVIRVASRSHHSISERFNKVFRTCRFTIFPVNCTSWRSS